MFNGKCRKCGSDEVFKSINGIISGDKKVYIRNISILASPVDRLTLVCTRCGYYENYILDESMLEKIKSKWDRVNA